MEDKDFVEIPRKPLPVDKPITPEGQQANPSILKYICLTILMLMVGGGLAFAVVSIGLTPDSFLTDQACAVLVENASNQSFINGSTIGFEQGKLFGSMEVSNNLLQYNQMPVYYQINETTIGWTFINMTDYYLNISGGK